MTADHTCPVHDEFARNMYGQLKEVKGSVKSLEDRFASISRTIYIGAGIVFVGSVVIGPILTSVLAR